jgi:hypothetical protein
MDQTSRTLERPIAFEIQGLKCKTVNLYFDLGEMPRERRGETQINKDERDLKMGRIGIGCLALQSQVCLISGMIWIR